MMNVRTMVVQFRGDARGTLRFCNEFDMSAVKRFYTVSNSAALPRRGWIMHRRETKWFFPLRGVTKVFVASDGDELKSTKVILAADEPMILQVNPCNWFMIEQDGSAEVQVFSNCSLGEFNDDDFRRPLL